MEASSGHLAIHGEVVILGGEPDGDSARFSADEPGYFRRLVRGERVKPSVRDGSVQLRLEGIDAPELHYFSASQPLAVTARNHLLHALGFAEIQYAAVLPRQVAQAQPAAVRGAILTATAEANGRPVAYLVLGADAHDLPDGQPVWLDAALLDRTVNARLLGEGAAYYTGYTTMPAEHRQWLRGVAAAARAAGRGVWRLDRSANFTLHDRASIGPTGQLILPKLFRRCTDYLQDVATLGYRGTLPDWLLARARGPAGLNDEVLIGEHAVAPLSSLLEQRGRHIAFLPDLLDVTFVQR